MKTFSVGL